MQRMWGGCYREGGVHRRTGLRGLSSPSMRDRQRSRARRSARGLGRRRLALGPHANPHSAHFRALPQQS
jgi:hypothetical protein